MGYFLYHQYLKQPEYLLKDQNCHVRLEGESFHQVDDRTGAEVHDATSQENHQSDNLWLD